MTDWRELESKYIMQVTRRVPLTLVRGLGCRVWDDEGKEYLDFVGGWASTSLGHSHPALVEAITRQAQTLILASNQFYTVPQVELAKFLVEHSALDRAFFSNSGAEALEGSVKLARRYGGKHRNGAYEVISTLNSFHGRTLAMVAATGQAHYQDPYRPLAPGFVNVPYDDVEAVKAATSEKTIAVLVEPVQGEGGVIEPAPDYLKRLRAWCDANGLLLILDEVQTGMGRMGSLFAYQQAGVEPDIMALAKGLGSGIAIGAFLAKERVASAFEYGDHGSTFGGNALACAAALAVARTIVDEDIPGQAARKGEHLTKRLRELEDRHPSVSGLRGRGLLQALVFHQEIGQQVLDGALKRGLLLNRVRPNAIRFMPPLIVTTQEIDRAVEIIDDVLKEIEVAR